MARLLWIGWPLALALLALSLLFSVLLPPAAWLCGVLALLVLALVLVYRLDWSGTPLVIAPTAPTGLPLAIVVIQGEGIPPDRYRPLAEAIQRHLPDHRLWVAVPRFLGDSPIPREMPLVVDQARRALRRQGLPAGSAILFLAHSVGGIALQKYLKAFPEQGIGQVLLGSFLGRWNLNRLDPQGRTLIDFPLPTLTVAGTLDGLARMSRMAIASWLQGSNAAPQSRPDRFPVVTIEGASHMQFASGEPVPFVAAFDLLPSAEEAAVHERVGELVAAFLPTCVQGSTGALSPEMAEAVAASARSFDPLVDALLAEGYNGFKPACYDTAETNSRTDPSCTPFAPWIQDHANTLMAAPEAAPQPFTVMALDSFHRSYTYNPFAKPPVHVPQIEATVTPGQPNRVLATSVTQALYGLFTALDTGFFPVAAFSLRCKLNSRQSFWSQAGVVNPAFAATDGPSRGQPINAACFAWTLARMAPAVRERFAALGQPMAMQPDTVRPAVGPLWIWSYPRYNYQPQVDGGLVYGLSCTVMKTPLDYPIAAARGFHYCQLLSPAAAMEWICIDGLRQRASCSGRLFVYGPIGGLDKATAYFGRSLVRQTRTAGLLRRR
ncbi:MAG: alpha/beta hydrolase [Cyanobacteria bacterium REEB498]|nr:alpha/beta hydrolase [Cyanobacteria bacterium REEB498]